MKRSKRILATILLLSTLLCALSIVFFEQISVIENENSIDSIENLYNEHDQNAVLDQLDPVSSSSLLDMSDIIGETNDDEDTVDGEKTTNNTSKTDEVLIGTGIAGDINADGVVNNVDAILLYRFVSKENVAVDPDSLDVNGNGIVNQEDVVAIFRYVSGWTDISIGYGYGWALKCAHETEQIPAVPASCINDGNIEYWRCKLCGLAFSDITCENVISDADIVISAYSQHTFDMWSVISAPSCTEKGLKQHTCTNCAYNEVVEIDVLEHIVDEYYTEKEPTCSEPGVKVGICSICGNQIESEIPALGHEAGDPVDTTGEMCLDRAAGTISCVKCGEVLSTYGHYYVTTIVEATCTTDGEIRKECSRCHDVETTAIAHGGHVEGFLTIVKEATCTETGSMAIGCLYCDYIFTDTIYEIPASEHDYTISQTEEFYLLSCKNCSHSYTTEKEDISVFKITFVSSYGETVDSMLVQEGVQITLPVLSADGYTFCGWFIDQALESPFDEEYIEGDLTLYAKWESQGNTSGSDTVLSNMPEDFSFTIKANGLTELTNVDNFLLVIDSENNVVAVKADNIGEGIFKITPCELYQKGEIYKILLRGDTEFTEYDGEELWFTIKEDNTSNVSVHPYVVQINSADIFAITEGDEDSWYFMLYDDILDVNNYFVVYDGDITNIIHSGKVYEEGTFDKYYIYRIDELTDEEISEVFVDIDIHYEGVAELGDFIPDENIVENVEQEFLQSALYRQIETAATTFAHLSSDGKYYYDYHYPKVSTTFKRDGSKIIFTFTVDVVFGRLDTDTREVRDLYTVTFKIKNETTFNVVADAQSINRYELIFTPVNKTTVGLYAKAGGKVVNDERLSFFKEIFIKAKDSGETDSLENIAAEYRKETPLGVVPLFVIPGVSIKVEVYNVFSFEAVGEIGLEVVTQVEPSIGIANYGNGVKVIKDFKYNMSVNAYAHAKIQVSDRLGAKVEVSLIGMIHASAGIEVGPYAEAGGLLNVVMEWGTGNPINFGATSGGYVEAGVDVEAYAELKITTLVFKIKLYQNRWNFFNKSYVLFSIGNKEMPIKFETSEEPITKKADLLYPIDLLDSIGTNVIYQNLQTMSTSQKQVNAGIEIVDQPEYATLSKKGVLILNEKVGDRTYVDLKIKVTYKTLFKIVDVRIYIEHDYADEFTCHDRTCLYCGYVCKATTPHVYSEWEAISEGVCAPDPYFMRICFDCRTCEFSGIDSGEAQHHDYQLVPGESVEPTCTEDGYLTYRCARENCQSETQIAVAKSYGSHDLIWIDGGETHYQHCQRVGCGYNSEESEHVSNTSAGCLNDQTCRYCGHIIESALGHDYKTIEAKEPTCTEYGYYNYLECSRCGDKVGYTEIPALNHSYTIQWEWNGFTSVIAVAICVNGHSETYTVVPTSSISVYPSCTTPGQRVYTASVKVDGVLYNDSITETLLPLGHNIIEIASKEPTCTTEGWYDYEMCTRCDHTTKVIRQKSPHVGGTATCTARAICDVCHNAYGEKLRHNYGTQYIGDATGHYHVCVCGDKDEIVKHTPDKANATEDESVICIVCAYVIEPATGHVNHNYTILCCDDTHHWYQCDQCSEINTKVAHSGGIATCKAHAKCDVCQKTYGEYGVHDDEIRHNNEMHWSYCSVCHRVAEKENHHGGEATCIKQAECVDCKELYGEKKEHDFSNQWHYNDNNHYHMCACGELNDLAQHTPDRTIPTETEPVVCSVCECVLIPATGHINHNYSILQYNETTHWYKCSGCDLKINETSHNGGSATCTEKAACAVCGQHYGEEPDHKYVLESDDFAHWYRCELCDLQGIVSEHEGGYSTCITRAECDFCGKEYGDYREHSYEYEYDDLQHWQYCIVCRSAEEAYNHSGGTATCTQQAVCDICHQKYGELASHIPNADDGDCTTPIACSVCGTITTSANAHHIGGTATCTKKAECTVCGKEYGELKDHTPNTDDGDCTTPVKCSVCGAITTPAQPHHSGGSATCTKKAECIVCGMEYGHYADHIPNKDDGNCTTAINCSVCGEITTAAKTHAFDNACDTDCNNADCYYTREITHSPGKDDGDCTTPVKCSVCGAITTPAKPHHSGGSATCTKKAECIVCGMEYGDYADHIPNKDDGDCSTAITCSVCGNITTEAKTHAFDNACDTDCNNSDCYYTREITHSPGKDDGDCTTPVKCSVCGAITTPAQPHHSGGSATCTEKAECIVCGMEYGDYADHIPNKDDGDCSTAITCSVCGNITTEAKEHNFGSNAEYDYNDDGHWRICANAGCSVTNQATGTQSHSYGEWYIPSHDRSIHAKECVCGKIVWEKHIPMEDDDDCTTPVFCSICNLTAIQAQDHDFETDYASDGTYHWHVCGNSGCLAADTKSLHSYGDWSIDENNSSLHKHSCTVCGYTESVAHDFVNGSYVSDDSQHWKECKYCDAQDVNNKETHNGTVATCVQKSKCLICNAEYGSVDPDNHDYEFNYDDVSHYDECTGCHKIINSSKHTIDYRVDVEQIVGTYDYRHSFTEFCTGCEYSKVLSTENIHTHENSETYGNVPATCESSGYQAGLRCAECDHVYFEPTVIPALGHAILDDGWVEEKSPTCTQEGYIGHEVCKWCACALDVNGNRLSDISIPKTNHILGRTDGSIIEIDIGLIYQLSDYPEFVAGCIGVPPTDATAGQSSFCCDTCGETVFVQVLGHYFEIMYDDTNHWSQCAVSGCSAKKDMTVHQFSQGICDICGYKSPYSVGLAYTISSDGTSYTVSGIGSCTDTDIVIPSTYNGLPVTAIGSSAFQHCSDLISVKIPSSITSIGSFAFNGCYNLTRIEIPENVSSMGRGVFAQCRNLTTVYYNAVNCVIINTYGDGSWGNDVFNGAGTETTGITFYVGNKVQSIPAYLFAWDISSVPYEAKLIAVVFEEGSVCESIGKSAFNKCYRLTNITIPASVKSIESGAFSGCYHLAEVKNLSSLEITAGSSSNGSVGYYAKNVFSSDEDRRIFIYEDYAFIVDDNDEYHLISYLGSDADLILPILNINGRIISYQIADYAFYNEHPDHGLYITYSNINSVIIPEGVTSIGYSAFSGCYNIKIIEIPSSVTNIDNYAFKHCSSLTSITIPEGVTSIGSYAFDNCTSLESVTIGSGVQSIDAYAFSSCISLESIIVDAGNTKYKSDGNCLIEIATNTLVLGCKNSVIPDYVQSIGNYAFYNCTGLTSITIPEGVTSIGNSAFSNCTGLTSITIPEGVTSIGNSAFSNCTGLTSITIPEGVTSIGNYAFYNCTGLTSITIPEGVTSIGNSAFSNCTGLTSITIPEGVTSIGNFAFYNCRSLTSIEIPSSVTSIGSSAFYNCLNLVSITYTGTIEQWTAVTKGGSWNGGTGNYIVHCSDGDIAK